MTDRKREKRERERERKKEQEREKERDNAIIAFIASFQKSESCKKIFFFF